MRSAATSLAAVITLCLTVEAAAAPQVSFRSAIGGPVEIGERACEGTTEGLLSDAAPLIGAVPGKSRRLRAVYQAHGERVQIGAASNDGGRSWSRQAIPAATQCLGGRSDHNLSVNPLFDVGARGTAWFGASWFNDPAADTDLWSYGVDLHVWPDAAKPWQPPLIPPPADESSQNLAVAAHPRDRDEVAVAWTHLDQLPNPITYAPTGTELRFATRDDGAWSPTVVVHETGPDRVIVNSRLVRLAGGGYAAIFDVGALADLPAAQLGLAEVQLPIYASRSVDGVEWSPPVEIGVSEQVFAEDPEGDSAARIISPKFDIAAGPDGSVAVVWAESARNTVRLATSVDGGITWSPAEDTVRLGGPGIEPAVAFDRSGDLGIFHYDAFSDTVRDDAWMVQPRLAVRRADGSRWRDLPLSRPFDARKTELCDPVCESHASALGVQQDVEGLRRGFGVSYTVGPPLARDGRTDAVYARVK